MYRLKQAAILAYKLLVKRLEKHGYYAIPMTNGLFAHKNLPTKFSLCVDDFGIKYNSNQDLQHLIQTLKKYYDISIDKAGKNYCGLTFNWNYREGYVDISMLNYVPKALAQFNHPTPTRLQYAPHKWTKLSYGQKIQHLMERVYAHLSTNGCRKSGFLADPDLTGTVLRNVCSILENG